MHSGDFLSFILFGQFESETSDLQWFRSCDDWKRAIRCQFFRWSWKEGEITYFWDFRQHRERTKTRDGQTNRSSLETNFVFQRWVFSFGVLSNDENVDVRMSCGNDGIRFTTNDVGVKIETSSSMINRSFVCWSSHRWDPSSYLSRTFNELVVFWDAMFPRRTPMRMTNES